MTKDQPGGQFPERWSTLRREPIPTDGAVGPALDPIAQLIDEGEATGCVGRHAR